MKNKQTNNFFSYKGKPLVRCNDTIFYGDMNDSHVAKITSKSTTKIDDLAVSNSVTVELIDTDTTDIDTKKIIKTSEKNGLYPALDIASVWLERALAN